ncbi:MAG: hypothetical protein FWD03_09935, partial [Defluviitaleaceae bacterium]|nr:hypothetical protein [Defluviitaleaceae bacterium]
MKNRRPRRKVFALGFIAATILFTTVVAAQFIGSFERLEGIIGSDDAAMLIPVEIATVDEGQSVTYDGIRAELVAVGVFGNIVDAYFTLEDTVSNRLEGGLLNRDVGAFSVDVAIRPYDIENFPMGAMMGSFDGTEIIHEDENGKLTLHVRYTYGESVAGQQLIFGIGDIMYDVHDVHNHPADINLADFVSDTEASYLLYRYDNPNPWGSSFQGEAVFVDGVDNSLVFEEQIREAGMPVLAPHMLNISSGIAQANVNISSVGVIDGRLHVQLYYPNRQSIREQGREGSAHIRLFRGDLATLADSNNINWDDFAFPYFATDFNIAEDGSFNRNELGVNSFMEYIFDIDLANIHEYTLLINSFGYRSMRLDWQVPFNADDHYKQLEKVADVDIAVGSHLLTRVNINPFGLLLIGESVGDTTDLNNVIVRVHTTEGVVTPDIPWGFSPLDRFMREVDDSQPMAVNRRFTFDRPIDLDNV